MSLNYTAIYNDLLEISGECNSNKILDFINYNTLGGKEHRSLLFGYVVTETNTEKIKCIFELLQSSYMVADDVMDESDTRRNIKCYYKKTGLVCLKYTQYFFSSIGHIFKKSEGGGHLRPLHYKVLLYTCLGQILDALKKSKEQYKISLYNTIAEYKTSYYSLYFPLSAGYIFIKKTEPKNLLNYCRLVGIIWQMLDDMGNFYPKVIKKTGNDLEVLKVTFFTCKLAEENSELVNNYFNKGVVNNELIEKVKTFFPSCLEEIKRLKIKLNEFEKGMDKNVIKFSNEIFKKREVFE